MELIGNPTFHARTVIASLISVTPPLGFDVGDRTAGHRGDRLVGRFR
jgi:hypothetical protein